MICAKSGTSGTGVEVGIPVGVEVAGKEAGDVKVGIPVDPEEAGWIARAVNVGTTTSGAEVVVAGVQADKNISTTITTETKHCLIIRRLPSKKGLGHGESS